jgi:hypothetical protein
VYLGITVIILHFDNLLHFKRATSTKSGLRFRECASAVSCAGLRKLDRPTIPIVAVAHNDAECSGVPARHHNSGLLSALRD